MKLLKADNGYIITAFEFKDLQGKARENAINSHRDFLVWADSNDPEYEGCEYTDEYVIDNIEANEYLFDLCGELLPMTHYTGKHEYTGKHTIRIFEQEIFCTLESIK